VRALGERVLFRAAAPNHPLSIVALDLASGSHRVLQKATRILDNPDLRIGDYLTTVRPVEFPTTGGRPRLVCSIRRTILTMPARPTRSRRCSSCVMAARRARPRAA